MTVYERQIFITGYRIDKSRPKRSMNDRNSISFNDYPYHFYPSYLSTECFLMTKFSVHLFYLASNYISLFPFDSIYLGLLGHSMSIEFIENNQIFLTSESNSKYFQQISLSKLKTKKYFNQSFICHYGLNHDQLINYWKHFYQD